VGIKMGVWVSFFVTAIINSLLYLPDAPPAFTDGASATQITDLIYQA
jgi:hypothetical protein